METLIRVQSPSRDVAASRSPYVHPNAPGAAGHSPRRGNAAGSAARGVVLVSPLEWIDLVLASDLRGAARVIAIVLARHASRRGSSFCSISTLAREAGLTERGARKGIAGLLEGGVVVEDGRRGRAVVRRLVPERLRSVSAEEAVAPQPVPQTRNVVPGQTRNVVPPEAERGSGLGRNVVPLKAERGSVEGDSEEDSEEDIEVPPTPPGGMDLSDPVVDRLRVAWSGAWSEATGTDYPFDHRRDSGRLRRLSDLGGPRELAPAFRVFLQAHTGSPAPWPEDEPPTIAKFLRRPEAWILLARRPVPRSLGASFDGDPDSLRESLRVERDGEGWRLYQGATPLSAAPMQPRLIAEVLDLLEGSDAIPTGDRERVLLKIGVQL